MNAICRRAARVGLLLVLLGVSCLVAGSTGFDLLTTEEYQEEKDARSMVTRGPGARAVEPESEHAEGGPLIEILAPDARKVVKAPVDISVRFSPGAGSTIVLESLRIRYGMIGLDVTDRIRKAATVTERGIEATGAALPAGSHSMSIEIADSAGRNTKQGFKFQVEK